MTTKPTTLKTAPNKYAHINPLPDPPQKLDGMQESRYIFNARFVIERHFKNRQDVLINGSATYATAPATAATGPTPT